MQLILITDVFGRTKSLDQWAAWMADAGLSCTTLDPYRGAYQPFDNEAEAYAAFIKNCGHDRYAKRVQAEIARSTEACVVIGFSAGASAAWRALGEGAHERVNHLIGFYPGQIRHHVDLQPSCPATLVFPRREAHFEVPELIEKLAALQDVLCLRTAWLHGFMNPRSRNYSEEGESQFTEAFQQPERLQSVTALRQHWRTYSLDHLPAC